MDQAAGRVPIIEPVLRPIEMFDVFGIDPAGLPPYRSNVGGGEACAAPIVTEKLTLPVLLSVE